MGILISIAIYLILACGDTQEMSEPVPDPPVISVSDTRGFEMDGGSIVQFEVRASFATERDIQFDYEVKGITAEPGVDFTLVNGSLSIPPGESRVFVDVVILDDDVNEVDESFNLTISNGQGATIGSNTGIAIISDDDDAVSNAEDGYITSEQHFGYNLMWSDEFVGDQLDLNTYGFELGDGCPNLCGWGNNELQLYTDSDENVFIDNGKLIIKADEGGEGKYNSARVTTKGKRDFGFSRMDIRAKLPKGQGIWPAIWMLGSNIDDVGWPASGEIDIMELVGHEPEKVHGTAHWGPQGRSFSTFSTGTYSLAEGFDQAFHVFTLIWENDRLDWYVDETKFHSITPADMQGEAYRFNAPFYLLFNVAVGGNWPGNPDETTQFPQQMEVDYVRVFERN